MNNCQCFCKKLSPLPCIFKGCLLYNKLKYNNDRFCNLKGGALQSILITIDVEDWFQVENFKQNISFSSWPGRELRVEKNTHLILDLLDSIPIKPSTISNTPKVTFFILGWIAERLPQLIREIAKRGHEIASHGYYHNLSTDNTPSVMKNDLMQSKKLLEDIIGARVYGYRAPSFSINKDVMQMIEDCGYYYDSSFNSFGMHGRYGHLDLSGYTVNGSAIRISDKFHELPISNLSLWNQIIPWGGGGYFRLIPFPVFSIGVQSILKNKNAYLFYMHPWEVDPDQPKVKTAPAFYRFRHYTNLKKTTSKLSRFIRSYERCNFLTCRQYLEHINQ